MNKENFIATIANCSKEQLNDIIKKKGKKRKPIKPIIYHIINK